MQLIITKTNAINYKRLYSKKNIKIEIAINNYSGPQDFFSWSLRIIQFSKISYYIYMYDIYIT